MKDLLTESIAIPDEIDPDVLVYLIMGTKPEELSGDDWHFIESFRYESVFVYRDEEGELVIDDS